MKMRSVVGQLFGWIFLAAGIAGLFLPFLQGILFILIGLMILSCQYQWAHKILVKVKKRFPKIAEQSDGFLQKMRKRFPAFNREHGHDK